MWPFNSDKVDELRQELRQVNSVVEDLRLRAGTKKPPSGAVQMAIRAFRRQSPSTKQWESGRGLLNSDGKHGHYSGPLHNLSEIAKAKDVESYFARAIERQRVLCMKQGWRIRGRDAERARYITRRVNEMMLMTGHTFTELLSEIFDNLFTYSNSFWVFKRDDVRSSGGKIRFHKRTYQPMAGVWAADPTTVQVKQSKSGLIERWRQVEGASTLAEGGSPKTFRPADVLHISTNRKTGWVFGTPYVVPVLDDMRLLRRMEELADIIAHKHAFPLMIVKIGTETKPADEVMQPGGAMIPEVEIAKNLVEQIDPEGGLVVTERYDIQMIGAENKALDLKPYLEYLEARVKGGLRLSDIDLGRGDSANRNTAQSITQNLIDVCTEVQRTVEEVISWKFFFFLLMEGDFNVDLARPEEDLVYLDFPPIDTEEQRAEENHAQGLYEGNTCTEDECRERMGRKPIPEGDREGMYLKRVSEPQSEMETAAAQKIEKTKAANKSATQPSNQQGKKATKPKQSKNRRDACGETYQDQVDYHYNLAASSFLSGLGLDIDADPHMADRRKGGRRAPTTRGAWQTARLVSYLRAAEAGILMEARTYLAPIMEEGFVVTLAGEKVDRPYVSRQETDAFFREHVRDRLRTQFKTTSQIMRRWRYGDSSDLLRSKLEIYGGDLSREVIWQAKAAYAYGAETAAERMGVDKISLRRPADGVVVCKQCVERDVEIPAGLRDMVCLHPACRMEYAVLRKDC